MSEEPEALRLIKQLPDTAMYSIASSMWAKSAAAELRRLHEVNQELVEACIKTIEENLHLADGDVCTLIHLKRAIAKARGEG